MKFLFSALLIFLFQSIGLHALELPKNASRTHQNTQGMDRYKAPFTPFADGKIEFQTLQGRIERSVWHISGTGLSTLQILDPLHQQLESEGFKIALDCDQESCGGFDFRFNIEVIPAPDMHVNMRAFRYLTAYKGKKTAPTQLITIMVSSLETTNYVQIIQATDSTKEVLSLKAGDRTAKVLSPQVFEKGSVAETLLAKGSIVLEGVAFESGTTNVDASHAPVLDELAEFFKTQSDILLILVGHTDSVGSLEANIALSKKRAQAVRTHLLKKYDLDETTVIAQGNGYLSPLQSNLTAQGREANRRVEAIIIPK